MFPPLENGGADLSVHVLVTVMMFGIGRGCGVPLVLGLAPSWNSPLELVSVPDLECVPEELV